MRHFYAVSALAFLLAGIPALAEEPPFAFKEGTRIAQLSSDALAIIADTRPATELSPDELAARIKSLRQMLASEELPDDVKNQLKGLLKQARSEVAARAEAGDQPVA